MTARRRREPIAFGIRVVLYVVYALPLLWISAHLAEEPGRGAELAGIPVLRADTRRPTRMPSPTPRWATRFGSRSSSASARPWSALCSRLRPPTRSPEAGARIVVIALALLVILQMIPQTANLIPLFWLLAQWGLLDTNAGLILADAVLLLPWAILLLRPFFATHPAVDRGGESDRRSRHPAHLLLGRAAARAQRRAHRHGDRLSCVVGRVPLRHHVHALARPLPDERAHRRAGRCLRR